MDESNIPVLIFIILCLIIVIFAFALRRIHKALLDIKLMQYGLNGNGKKISFDLQRDTILNQIPQRKRYKNSFARKWNLFISSFLNKDNKTEIQSYIKHYYSPERNIIYNPIKEISGFKNDEKIKNVDKKKVAISNVKIFDYEDKFMPDSDIDPLEENILKNKK